MPGCTSSWAPNYNISATVDDGSCESVATGCTDIHADNFEPSARAGDPSVHCIYVGCTDSVALNYSPDAQFDAGNCTYFPSPPNPPAAPPHPPIRGYPFSDGSIASVATVGPFSSALASLLSSYDGFATSISLLGDVDGDAITTEFAVGAESSLVDSRLSAGALYILSITQQGSVSRASKISAGIGGLPAGALSSFDYFGCALAHIGDLDGNSATTELAVGARGDDAGGQAGERGRGGALGARAGSHAAVTATTGWLGARRSPALGPSTRQQPRPRRRALALGSGSPRGSGAQRPLPEKARRAGL